MPTEKPKSEKPAKRKSKKQPGARSLEKCRALGWRAQVVEKWIPMIRRRKDLFGFGDVIALDGEPGSLLIQACITGDAPKRAKKILEECTEAAIDWLEAGNRIQVWGWAKRGARGKRKLWTLKRYVVEYKRIGTISRALVCEVMDGD